MPQHTIEPALQSRSASRAMEQDVLQILDSAKFQWFHYKAILIVGFGWLVVGWQTILNHHMLNFLQYTKVSNYRNGVPHGTQQALMAALLVSTMLGCLVLGVLADLHGRKRVYLLNTAFMIVGGMLSAVATWGTGTTVIWLWGLWRVLLGFGLGGEFPITAALTAEFSNKRWRGAIMGFAFAMFGCGWLVFTVLCLVVVCIFKDSILKCRLGETCQVLDYVWRICMVLSCFPAAGVLLFRNQLPETPRWTMFVECNMNKATEDSWQVVRSKPAKDKLPMGPGLDTHSWADWQAFWRYLQRPKVAKHLLLSSFCAFLSSMSTATYGTVAFTTILDGAFNMVKTVEPGNKPGHTIYDMLYNLFAGWAAVYSIICLLGHCGGWLLIDFTGRRLLQAGGFALQAATLLTHASLCQALAGCTTGHSALWPAVLLIMACMFTMIGPSISTWVWPAELFATRFRARMHGVVSASGVMGQVVSLLLMDPWWNSWGHLGMLNSMGAAAALGAVISLSLPETKGLSLEELSGELDHSTVASPSTSRLVDGQQVVRERPRSIDTLDSPTIAAVQMHLCKTGRSSASKSSGSRSSKASRKGFDFGSASGSGTQADEIHCDTASATLVLPPKSTPPDEV